MRLARQTFRYSGRTAMNADRTIHEPKPSDDPDSPFVFSMEGYEGVRERGQIPYFWAPGWNSVQSVNKFQDEIGGPLRGGDPGKNLIEPGAGKAGYYDTPPRAFDADARNPRAFPVYRIFGSDELSALAPDLARRIPEPFAMLHPEDAKALNLDEGSRAVVTADNRGARLRVHLEPTLTRGAVGVAAGFPETAGMAPNGPVTIEGGTD